MITAPATMVQRAREQPIDAMGSVIGSLFSCLMVAVMVVLSVCWGHRLSPKPRMRPAVPEMALRAITAQIQPNIRTSPCVL
jgi:hypothetical protein